MFINFSNHPSCNWGEDQLKASAAYGEIVDMQFPAVGESDTSEQVRILAHEIADRIITMQPAFVLCQGEFCLAFNVAAILKNAGIRVGAACSERQAMEIVTEDGSTRRTSVFRFVQYREY